ncbi:hypothetical protein ACFLTE_01910 [Bacteroidota bacterium]
MNSIFKTYLLIFIYFFLSITAINAIQLSDSIPTKIIHINEEVIQAFKTIWNEEHSPLVYDEYINSDTIVEGGEAEILRTTIIDYFYNTDTTNDTLGFMDLLQENIIEYREGPKEEEYIVLSEDESDKTVIDESIDNVPAEEADQKDTGDRNLLTKLIKKDKPKTKPKKKSKSFTPESDEELVDLIFNVQVAASRKLLDLKTISQIYNGNYPIFISFEDGWYKYRIGKTTSITEANKLKVYSNVKGAFIVAYKENKKLSLKEYKKIIKEPIALQNKTYNSKKKI